MKLATSIFIAITALTTASKAAVVTYDFTVRANNFSTFGDVTNIEPFFAGVVPGVTELEGFLSYESETAPFPAGSTTVFNNAGQLSLTFPGFDFEEPASILLNDGTFGPQDRLEFRAASGDPTNGFSSLASISFRDAAAVALDTQNELPPSILLDDFSTAFLTFQITERLSASNTVGALTLRGTITSLTDPNAVETVPLPVPGVLLLAALGAGGLMFRRRAAPA